MAGIQQQKIIIIIPFSNMANKTVPQLYTEHTIPDKEILNLTKLQ
jgi:hypothetical protein